MLTEFESFNIKDFFALRSEAIVVDFLVILFVPQARISEEALLISLEASISIDSIFSSNIPSNRTKLLISFQIFNLP